MMLLLRIIMGDVDAAAMFTADMVDIAIGTFAIVILCPAFIRHFYHRFRYLETFLSPEQFAIQLVEDFDSPVAPQFGTGFLSLR